MPDLEVKPPEAKDVEKYSIWLADNMHWMCANPNGWRISQGELVKLIMPECRALMAKVLPYIKKREERKGNA